jgi:glycosyltransferase involved in cell wall biosynthesis
VSSTRRKVIQLTPYYPPHLGGVERVAEALARGLAPTHDVEVWTTDIGATEGADAGAGTTGTDPGVHPIATAPGAERFPVYRLPAVEIAHTPLARRLFTRLLALPTGSIVHVHVAQAWWPELVAVAATRRRFRVVAHFHLDVDPTGPTGVLLPLYKSQCLARSLRRADAVLALTDSQADFLVRRYDIAPAHLHVLPNGVDRRFLELGPHPRRPGDPLRALFVGRLERQKNIPRLLRALALVDEPVEVVVVGDGEQRERCQAMRDELGLEGVRFVGRQSGPALQAWYAWADVFVLPSDREGMPLALLEAMAAGLAVVATDVSDVAVQVGDAGVVVAPDDGPLAEAIASLARHQPHLSTLQGRSRARGRAFGWDAVVARLATVYESLPA